MKRTIIIISLAFSFLFMCIYIYNHNKKDLLIDFTSEYSFVTNKEVSEFFNQEYLVLAFVEGACNSNALEIDKIQDYFINNFENQELVFVFAGELCDYIKAISEDNRIILFPAIYDPDYKFYIDNPFLKNEDQILILKKDKSIIYKGNPFYKKRICYC